MTTPPPLTLGIEEEYLIVDAATREVVREPDPAFMAACEAEVGTKVTPEFLQCQIEVGTAPHATVSDAIEELRGLRACLLRAAEAHGYRIIAASTHPFSSWKHQTHTKKERYATLRSDLGFAVQRMLICGMHIHIGIENEDLRIDLMNQAAYFLPHLLALSCSSPYWEGQDTGLASYRLTVFDALPRTGLPDQMTSYAEYRRLVDHMVATGSIEDATKIWWDLRPSDNYPTIEQRITDVCSDLSDAAAIAALFQSLVSYLWRLKQLNQRWRVYPPILVNENRWLAQRYGTGGKLVDHGRSALVPFGELAAEMVELFAADAASQGCLAELKHAETIAARGTSADRQRAAYAAAIAAGAEPEEACRAVVDHLVAEFSPG